MFTNNATIKFFAEWQGMTPVGGETPSSMMVGRLLSLDIQKKTPSISDQFLLVATTVRSKKNNPWTDSPPPIWIFGWNSAILGLSWDWWIVLLRSRIRHHPVARSEHPWPMAGWWDWKIVQLDFHNLHFQMEMQRFQDSTHVQLEKNWFLLNCWPARWRLWVWIFEMERWFSWCSLWVATEPMLDKKVCSCGFMQYSGWISSCGFWIHVG